MDEVNVTRAVIFGLPVTKKWAYYGPEKPHYYLDNNTPCYYFASTDEIVATHYLNLSKEERIRFAPTLCGFNPTDLCSIDYIKKMFENGEPHNDADVVISAADGYYTIFEMLGGQYIDQKIMKLYNEHPKWPSMVLVSLGVSRTFENEPTSIELYRDKEFVVDEQSSLKSVPITIYNFDHTLAPEGKTCIRVMLKTDNYSY